MAFLMSKSWKLVNQDGEQIFDGPMDIIINNGKVEELTNGEQILDQRIQKAITEKKGSNAFAAWWGTSFKERLGRKSLGRGDAQRMGIEVFQLSNALIASQREVDSRIGLDVSEKLNSISKLTVDIEKGKLSVSAEFETEDYQNRRVYLNHSEVSLDITKSI